MVESSGQKSGTAETTNGIMAIGGVEDSKEERHVDHKNGKERSSVKRSSNRHHSPSSTSPHRSPSRTSPHRSPSRSSPHRSKDRNKARDREAKRRSRRTENSISLPGAVPFNNKGDLDSSDREDRDREAKRRSRRTDTASTPGAVASKGEHSSSRSKSSSNKDKSGGGSHRNSDAKNKTRSSRASTPGAVASNEKEGNTRVASKSSKGNRDEKRRSGRKADRPGAEHGGAEERRSRKESRNEYKNNVAAASMMDREDQMPALTEDGEYAVVAETVEDDDEAQEKGSREQEPTSNVDENDEESSPIITGDKASDDDDKGRKRNTLFFSICCCLIVIGATTGGLFGAGIFSSSEEAVSGALVDVDTVVNETETPTEAPQAVVIPDTSESPTSAPTFFVYDPITADQCAAIASGEAVDGQEDMIEKSFALILDAQLSFDMEPPILLETMHQKIQEILAPKMAGCDAISRRRSLNAKDHDEYKYIVGNLVVLRVVETGEECSTESDGTNCLGMLVEIGIYVRGNDLTTLDYVGRMSRVLNGESDNLAIELQLDDPFRKVLLVQLLTLDPTTAPSIAPTVLASEGPSSIPTSSPTTTMPVSFPTTERPTDSPSESPILGASASPSQAPSTPPPTTAASSQPSLRPSRQPVPGQTPMPTSLPSRLPTGGPSEMPSVTPSRMPSVTPSKMPSVTPSGMPSVAPSEVPSEIPSEVPSEVPSGEPSKAASSQPSLAASSSPSLRASASPSILTREARIDAALTAAGYPSTNRDSTAYTWLTQTDTWEHETSIEDFHWVDRYVVKIFYQECGGQSWNNQDNWLSTSVGHCDWEHIICNPNGQIRALDIRASNTVITAPLPMELGSLGGLVTLKFKDDMITENGRIPPAITQLSKLQILELGGAAGLKNIGSEVSAMTNMKTFSARGSNNLDDGFPTGLLYWTKLEYLNLYNTNFNAAFPAGVSAWTNLKEFVGENSGLRGPLPPEFFQLENLEMFNCHKCYNFGGTIQTEWGSFPKLKNLQFNFASRSGNIPSEIGNLSLLTMLKLFSNINLSGTIPSLPSSLTTCQLTGNSFTNTANRGICSV